MSYDSAIYDRLNADSALNTLLTGGMLLYTDLPVNGISRKSMPEIYGTDGKLMPVMVVKGRALIPTGSLKDTETQYTSARQIIELYFYDDQAAGWGTIKTAADRVYELLQDRPVGASGLRLVNVIDNERNDALEKACMLRRDWEVIGKIAI